MKKKIEFDENKFFETLSICRDSKIKNLSFLISTKDRRPSRHENVLNNIRALFTQKTFSSQTIPSPSQGFDSEHEDNDHEHDRNEENYENEKSRIMAKLKTFFDVYKNNFFSHVEGVIWGERCSLTDL